MQQRSDRHSLQSGLASKRVSKRLGSYLVEAGLLTSAQLDVALNDQKMTEEMTGTHMQLGEIVAARGWIKEQTIEYLMRKIILPERQQMERQGQSKTVQKDDDTVKQERGSTVEKSSSQVARRDVPISKPLPSIPTEDGEVWVG